MAEKHKCAGKVWSQYSTYQCSKTGTLEHAGNWWCKTHHPPTVDAKTEARHQKWDAGYKARQEKTSKDLINKELADRAINFMRNEHNDVVQRWEEELNAGK